jgi:hypothetical protein
VGHEPQHDTLEEIVVAIKEHFGTDLDERDRLEVEKVQMTLNADEQLKTFTRVNAIDNFTLSSAPGSTARSSTPRPTPSGSTRCFFHQPGAGEDDRERGHALQLPRHAGRIRGRQELTPQTSAERPWHCVSGLTDCHNPSDVRKSHTWVLDEASMRPSVPGSHRRVNT